MCTCANSRALFFFKWFIIISFMNFSLALKELYIQVALVIYMCVFYVIKIQKWIQKVNPVFTFPLHKVFFFLPRLLREFLYRNSVSRFFTNQEIPGILWNLKVITMFIRAQLWFLSRATLIQLTDTLSSCFLQMYFNIILQSMLTSSK